MHAMSRVCTWIIGLICKDELSMASGFFRHSKIRILRVQFQKTYSTVPRYMPSGSYSAVESCEQSTKILVLFHPDLKSKYCFYAHMHEIPQLSTAANRRVGSTGIRARRPGGRVLAY